VCVSAHLLLVACQFSDRFIDDSLFPFSLFPFSLLPFSLFPFSPSPFYTSAIQVNTIGVSMGMDMGELQNRLQFNTDSSGMGQLLVVEVKRLETQRRIT
jgi:hypothetical protein